MTKDDKPDKGDKKLTICLKSASGGVANATFNDNQKVKLAVDEAIRVFNLDKNPPRPYEVHVEEGGRPGRALRSDMSFAAQGVKDKDCLIIAPPASPDGAPCDERTSST